MPELANHKILITGGAGFIGSHLADSLTPQNTVTVLDDLSSGDRANVPSDATLEVGDIRSRLTDLTKDIDIVFHDAAVVSVQQSIDHPIATHKVNTDATLHLLDLARERDFRVVLASSAAVYGHPDNIPIAEDDPKTPTSPYGIDKWTSDRYAQVYNDLYGVETVSLRYFNVYGPRQRAGEYGGVISIFQNQAQRGEPITIDGDGTQTRDFVHVSDVVDANLRAATTSHVGGAYNIGSGTPTSIKELAETIRDLTGSDSRITHTEPRPGDIGESVADISKARRDLGFEPTTDLEAGIKTLLE